MAKELSDFTKVNEEAKETAALLKTTQANSILADNAEAVAQIDEVQAVWADRFSSRKDGLTWAEALAIDLNPIVDLQYADPNFGAVSGGKDLAFLIREVGTSEAFEHGEVIRIVEWIAAHVTEPE